jgi:hypothetical protein
MARNSRRGEEATRRLSNLLDSVATKTTLKAVPSDRRHHGLIKMVEADGSLWRFHSSSTAADTSENVVLTPSTGSGRWLRLCGAMNLALPFTFATADAVVLFTVPTGALMLVRKLFWTISADLTGGSSSAIGVSSTKTGFTTKGDLLGGASGDVAASLTAALSPANGTIGAKVDTVGELHTTLWKAADILRFDRITSAFTAGSGSVNAVVDLLANDGA